MSSNVDPEFLEKLKTSVDETVSDTLVLKIFARSLERKYPQTEQLEISQIQQELKHGISIYWEETYAHGYSGDPW